MIGSGGNAMNDRGEGPANPGRTPENKWGETEHEQNIAGKHKTHHYGEHTELGT